MKPRTRFLTSAIGAVAISLCAVAPMFAQNGGAGDAPIPQLQFRLVEDFFQYPAGSVIGRTTGVTVGPDGTIATLNRGYRPVMEFNADGTFLRSWGEGSTMFHGAHVVRFDAQGDLWYVNAGGNNVYRFDSERRTIGTLGTNPEPWTWLTHVYEHGARRTTALYQPTDIAWSKDGSSYVADGYGNSRIAKFDKDGNFVMAWGERGSRPGQFNTPHGLVIDNNDIVYVADRGNSRIQVFDSEGNQKAVWDLPTAPWTLCVTNGPEQVLFVGSVGKVYKMALTGEILGAFGRRGRMPGTIDSVHQIACPDENTLYLAHTYASRFDKWVAE